MIRRLRKTDAFAVEMNGAGFCREQSLRNHLMQIAAMDGDVRKSVALNRFHAEVEQLPALAGVPQPDRLAGRQHLHLFQRVFQSERMEDARAIGADLDAGAEFAQFRRLLVDLDVDAAANERQRGRKPADAAADNRDLGHFHGDRHAGSPAASRSRSAKMSSPCSTTL